MGPQSQSARVGKVVNLLPLLRIEPRFLGRPSHSLVAITTELAGPVRRQTLRELRYNLLRDVKPRRVVNGKRRLGAYRRGTQQFPPKTWHASTKPDGVMPYETLIITLNL